MADRRYTLRTDTTCPCRGEFAAAPLECSECGHIGCVDCDCKCFPLDDYPTSDPDERRLGRVAHGVPARMDRLRALGNAVVPQVAQYIGELIMRADSEVAA